MWGPFYAAPRWGVSLSDYTQTANEEVLAIGMAEHVDVVKTISEIVSTPGLDMVFIGPGDLATSMGLHGRVDHAGVDSVIRKLEIVIRESRLILGGVATTTDQANELIDRGYRALIVGFDWLLLERGIESVISGVSR
jgi:4-hydroxy-2-oxoheptanedioate aldolase